MLSVGSSDISFNPIDKLPMNLLSNSHRIQTLWVKLFIRLQPASDLFFKKKPEASSTALLSRQSHQIWWKISRTWSICEYMFIIQYLPTYPDRKCHSYSYVVNIEWYLDPACNRTNLLFYTKLSTHTQTNFNSLYLHNISNNTDSHN